MTSGARDAVPGRGWRARAGPALTLIAVVAVFYGPAVGRSFTSEDFLLLRVLRERPPWQDVLGTVAGPWLGLTIVKFYRPVATTLFALEGAWFGTNPLPFNLVHVAVHAANAFLVAALARRLQKRFLVAAADEGTSWLAALLFAVYPLHPNAVLFAASFATIFATFFLIASAVLYCRYRDEGGPWTLAASLALFALALGSYESAVVLAGLLAVLELVAPRWPGAFVALAPYAALAGAYLALRRAIFGAVLGGYEDVADRLTTASLRAHGDNVVTSVSRLVLPLFEVPTPWTASLAILALIVLAPAVLYLATRRRVDSGHARLSLFAAAWVLLFMAPFAFAPVVPANGRYWYTVTIGAGIGLVTVARWLGVAVSRLGLAALAVPLAVATAWAALLSTNVETNRQAARTTRAIRAAVAEAAATDGASHRYLAGYPLFLTNRAGVAMAQVFHYGLSDSLAPPFVAGPAVDVYPLPPLAAAAFAPLARLPGAWIYEWSSPGARLGRLQTPDVPTGLSVTGPPDGAHPSALLSASSIAVTGTRGPRARLIVLAAGNWDVVEGDAAESHAARLTVPREFVRAMGQLYPRRELLWWVVGEDAAGRIVAASEVRRLVWR